MNFKTYKNYYVIIILLLLVTIILIFFLVKWLVVSPPIAQCDVVPFQSWANTALLRDEDLQIPVDLVVVTHTVTSECTSDSECRISALYIRDRHMGNGFMEIPLSFMVGGNGQIYEGAGWKVGAHTSGFNNRSISLSFMGDYRERTPSIQALDAAEKFLGCLLNLEYLTHDYNVVGHRQLISTISPGDALQEIIETWPRWTQYVT